MHNEQKDILLERLSAKLADYESTSPTDADWNAFARSYNKRKRNAIWFKLALLLVGMGAVFAVTTIILNNQQANRQPEPQNQDAPLGNELEEIDPKAPVKADQNVQNPILIQTKLTKEITREGLEEKQLVNTQTPNTTENLQNEKMATNKPAYTSMPANTIKGQEVEAPVAFNDELASTQTTGEQPEIVTQTQQPTHLDPRKMAVIGYGKKDWQPLLQSIAIPRDSTIYNIKTKSNSKVFVEAGALFTSTPHLKGIYPSNVGYNGLFVQAGYRIAPKWHIVSGVQWGRLISYDRYEESQTESRTTIARVDTTLKYHSGYNRIMMDIDTVTHTSTNNVQSSYSLNTERVWLAIPILAQFEFGNEKRFIGLSAGVVSTQISSITNTLVVTESGGQQRVSNNTKQWLFAPTVGAFGYQRIYKQVGAVAGVSYLTYLPNQLLQHNHSFQLSAGVRVQF